MRPPLSPNHPGSCTYLERLRGQGGPVVHCDVAEVILLNVSSLLTFSSNLRENTNQYVMKARDVLAKYLLS